MRPLFLDTRTLDKAARERYGLTEELMMENAAAALERTMLRLFRAEPASGKKLAVILCGGGNNGADGYALARRLAGYGDQSAMSVEPRVIVCAEPKTDLCRVQAARAKKCAVSFYAEADAATLISRADCIVDCIFGSGFHGKLDKEAAGLCACANGAAGVRVACDVPTGLCEDGTIADSAFCADYTVSMGARKLSLYSDAAKDYVGKIICGNLGVSRQLFEADGTVAARLLQASDLRLPARKKQLVNKGSFGHAAIASGEKIGASCIAGAAALRFGAGLVSLVRLGDCFDASELPAVAPELMTAGDFPANTTAVAFGMGLGRDDGRIQPYFDWLSANPAIPCVIDADAFFGGGLKAFLQGRASGTVLTPHPKEFQVMLQNCGMGNYMISDCVIARPRLIETFCRAFPHAVLLVKGANPMIGAYDGGQFRLFVNPLGKASLAKAGSGDVLAGLICALLAQGSASLDAAINGSLAHALASRRFKNDFSLTPLTLIDAIAEL